MIIFTTAYRKFALEGFEEDAIDYLLKPIPFDRFSRAVKKAVDHYTFKKLNGKKEEEDSFFVNSDYQKVKIDIGAIEYIESIEDYVKIYLDNQRPVLTLMTLKAMQGKLPANKFLRIHRSYIVPVAKIKSIVNRMVRLTNTELPISNSYIDSVNEWMRSKIG
jgi:two-component system LytT family response regulator